jgi:nicotinamidase-related amidase
MEEDSKGLRFGLLGDTCVHLCVDMQRLFAEETPWKTPWMERILPTVHRLVSSKPERTIFTRFVPVRRPEDAHGTWYRYYRRWSMMTIDELGPDRVDLIPELAAFVPPAKVFDKRVYSPWLDGRLDTCLREARIDSLVISGGETDVCVLGTVLGAVDRGYRVVIATDALCGSADETHDALMRVYETRYSQQVEAVTVEAILDGW